MMVSQGGFGAGTSGVGVRQIYETLFGAKGSTVNPELALFPDGKPPTKLPRISPATKPKPSILNPGNPTVAASASPSAQPSLKAKAKR
jgi:penicillin-binding protein 2